MNIKFITICLMMFISTHALKGEVFFKSDNSWKSSIILSQHARFDTNAEMIRICDSNQSSFRYISTYTAEVSKRYFQLIYREVNEDNWGAKYALWAQAPAQNQSLARLQRMIRELLPSELLKNLKENQSNILVFGIISLTSLFIITVIVTFSILHVRRNKNNPKHCKP